MQRTISIGGSEKGDSSPDPETDVSASHVAAAVPVAASDDEAIGTGTAPATVRSGLERSMVR
jgi:hypothetical protein